jgi:hypothetical protein
MKAAAAAGLDINLRWIEFRFSRVSKRKIHEAELAIYGRHGVMNMESLACTAYILARHISQILDWKGSSRPTLSIIVKVKAYELVACFFDLCPLVKEKWAKKQKQKNR